MFTSHVDILYIVQGSLNQNHQVAHSLLQETDHLALTPDWHVVDGHEYVAWKISSFLQKLNKPHK